MAHYAQVIDGVVQQVIVCDDGFTDTLPDPQNWVKTSYNTHGGVYYTPNSPNPDPDQSKAFRKNYASLGGGYDGVGFYDVKPYPSWVLNPNTYYWEAPVPYPDVYGMMYKWNEENLSWDPITPEPIPPAGE